MTFVAIGSKTDRSDHQACVDQLDGTVIAGWLAFGEYDIVAIVDMPDNVSAAAFSMAASAGGAVKSIKTTPLRTTEEGMRAMEKGQVSSDAPPPAAKPAVTASP